MMIRQEFTGMLPAAIDKFEALLTQAIAKGLNPVVAKGYDVTQGKDSYFSWGCACSIQCDDALQLEIDAENLGIECLGNGDFAYTNGLYIDDFKTYRVNGNLELMPEQEV